jgi:hypothetical protein
MKYRFIFANILFHKYETSFIYLRIFALYIWKLLYIFGICFIYLEVALYICNLFYICGVYFIYIWKLLYIFVICFIYLEVALYIWNLLYIFGSCFIYLEYILYIWVFNDFVHLGTMARHSKQTVTASNNTTFSTHSINAIKSAYANLAMARNVPLLNCIPTLTIYTFWNRHTMVKSK